VRDRVLRWLWLLVVLQVAVPASYYLLRDDRDDERFAWRMFSSVRLTRCAIAAFDEADGAPRRVAVDLPKVLHAGWLRSLERGRARVIEHFLASRCRAPQVAYGVLERRCQTPSGKALPPASYRYDCRRRALESAP
jgi:hypothetical protein